MKELIENIGTFLLGAALGGAAVACLIACVGMWLSSLDNHESEIHD